MEQARSTTEELQDEVWRNGALHTVIQFILNPRETEHNYKLYLNSLKRYKTFEEQLKSESGRYVELLMSGSMAECLFANHWVYEDGRREARNDIDIMLVDFSMTVVERKPVESSVCFDDGFAGVQDNNYLKELAHRMNEKCCDGKHVPLFNTEMSTNGLLRNTSGSESNCGDLVGSDEKGKSKECTQKDLFLEPTIHPGYVQLYELQVDGNPAFLSTENFKEFWREIVNRTALFSLVTNYPTGVSGGGGVDGSGSGGGGDVSGGSGGSDGVSGGGSDDVSGGGGGSDDVSGGGGGSDDVIGGDGSDVVNGGGSDDVSGSGSDDVNGGSGSDDVNGGNGSGGGDVSGGGRDDVSGGGSDDVSGGGGDDGDEYGDGDSCGVGGGDGGCGVGDDDIGSDNGSDSNNGSENNNDIGSGSDSGSDNNSDSGSDSDSDNDSNSDIDSNINSNNVVANGPALKRRDRPSARNNYAHDYVPCLHCPKWPSTANKWSERSRAVDWPSKDLISDILSQGCHVVAVSHRDNNTYNTEWRLSFSLAERMLVHSLSREQRQSYIIAKLIMKQVIEEIKDNRLLENTPSSYHLKTILLWKCEEKNLEEWNNILNSAVELLESFVDHLLRGNIPNYFIPENNMVSHIAHQDLVSVANGIAASLDNLPATLHKVFQAAYETLLDSDDNYGSVLRLVDRQLSILCQTGTAENKLYLCYILNSLVDSLSAAITGTSNELHHLADHKHILNIYCTHHLAAGKPLTLPTPPVLGAAEQTTTVMLLFQYLCTLLQDDHILTHLQNNIFAILSRIFSRTLAVISLNLSEQMSRECFEASLRLYQNVCTKLEIEQTSDLSCREELSTLLGLDFIFFKYNELTEMEAFKFATKRFQKFKNNGQLKKLKSLEW